MNTTKAKAIQYFIYTRPSKAKSARMIITTTGIQKQKQIDNNLIIGAIVK